MYSTSTCTGACVFAIVRVRQITSAVDELQSTADTSWQYISLLLTLCVRRSRHDPRCLFQFPSCLYLWITADTRRRNGFCRSDPHARLHQTPYLYKSTNATPFCLLALCLHRHVSMWRNADLSCDMARARKTGAVFQSQCSIDDTYTS